MSFAAVVLELLTSKAFNPDALQFRFTVADVGVVKLFVLGFPKIRRQL